MGNQNICTYQYWEIINKKYSKMKTIRYHYLKFTLLVGLIFVGAVSCDKHDTVGLELATLPTNGEVFIDGFSGGLNYYPFAGSKMDAFSVDTETKYKGTASMRFDVPNVGDPDGAYAGAIFPDATGRDLSGYDALTFWAKASQTGTINEIGFGNDFGENKYMVAMQNVVLSTNWKKFIIPLPDASKLTAEKGMFWYAEGPENGNGYSFWVDELKYEKLGTIAHPSPAILNGINKVEESFIGASIQLTGLTQTFNMATGLNQTVSVAPSYFVFTSSNNSVATVNALGVVSITGTGTAIIRASLNGVDASGSLTVNSLGVFTPAPTPTRNPNTVISIFSNAYTNVPVDYYNGYWAPYQTTTGQNDINVNGDNIIRYKNLNFVGIQFTSPTINASSMTHVHVDIRVQSPLNPGAYLKVKLQDIGSDNAFGGGNDTAGERTFTSPTLVNGSWVSLDLPLSTFTGLTSRANLAQFVFISDATISDIFVDNIYFYAIPTTPTVAAPTPTVPAANVKSVFSDAYTNIAGSDLNPNWGQSTVVTQTLIGGNNTLKYANLNYQGLQLGSAQNVTGMTHLHLDYYSGNSSSLKVYLISPGPVEKAKVLAVPTASGWVSIEIPLTDFSPVNLANIIQLKFDGNGDIFLDNIYFHN